MKLLFIYNANSGKLNAILHAGHKLFRPSTYTCSLCALTYDTFTEKAIWKSFKATLNLEMDFYHRDEFKTKFKNVNMLYPVILKLQDNQLTVVLNNEILNNIPNVDVLIKRLKTSL